MKVFFFFCILVSNIGFAQVELAEVDLDNEVSPVACTQDNKIYKTGVEYIYNYCWIKGSDSLKMILRPNPDIFSGNASALSVCLDVEAKWQLLPIEDKRENTISHIGILVPDTREYESNSLYENKTPLIYKLYNAKGEVKSQIITTLIENEKNIYLGLLKAGYFKMLYLNPHLYIREPFKPGNKWEAKVQLNSLKGGDKQWRKWQGEVEIAHSYKIAGEKSINTSLGILECVILEGKATSSLGKTQLKAFFNAEYGFVKIEYENIDNSKLVIFLERVNKKL